MSNILDNVIKENDIKEVDPRDYPKLAKEIRQTLVRGVSKTGGHLASNLGTVELTMALHLLLDFPEDKLVWDVGHQSYTHKLLTGRKDVFCSLRSFGGISGFPKVCENPSDTFNTGHSSTSISVALGLAKARDLQGGIEKVVAVIGDGALGGGMAYEALNNVAQLHTSMMIVLNDNTMSISRNVGGMANYLGKLRTNRKYNDLKQNVLDTLDKIPNVGKDLGEKLKRSKDSIKRLFISGMFFEDIGITYIGPINGHDIDAMLEAFTTALSSNKPVLVHVVTKKGKGYRIAEENPSAFHGVDPFDVQTGEPKKEKTEESYSDVFSKWMVKEGRRNCKLTAVCAAMADGTGLVNFSKAYPNRFFDVGIAEEHAVTFAAGLAAGGMRPVVALYSTFYQRAYDQILHDVCISSLPVVFAVDRSGIVGKDGETHQGIFDLSFLTSMPNMTVISPMDRCELVEAFNFAICHNGPVAIRYPRGEAYEYESDERSIFEYGKAEVLCKESEILIVGVGSMMQTALELKERLKAQGKKATLVNARFVKPFDRELLCELAGGHDMVITLEENVVTGGFGQQLEAFLCEQGYGYLDFVNVSLPDGFVAHGTPEQLKRAYGLDIDSILARL